MFSLLCLAAIALSPTSLTVEYRTNPIGIDTARPRLSWSMATKAGAKNERQIAYQIIVASSPKQLDANIGDLWNSGKVASERSLNIEYLGKPLKSSARVWWKVKTWNAANEESDWSSSAHWTQGLMTPWRAKWIGFKANPQPAFKKSFAIKPNLRFATLHISGLGYYVAQANGRRVGRKVMDPAPTSYDRRVLYSTYEIEDLLHEGDNELYVRLGRGWYDVPIDTTWNFDEAPWRDRPCLIAQLELVYADGSREMVVTDESWQTAENPVAYDSLREGEVVGAAGTKPTIGAAAEIVKGPSGKLSAEAQPGSEVVRTLKPVSVKRVPEGWMVAFAENITGFIRLQTRGLKRGDVVTVRYDERVEADGSPAKDRVVDCYSNERSEENPLPGPVFQTDRFVAAGDSEEVFEPSFNVYGFQYVLVQGLSAELRPEDVTACEVRTAFELTGSFKTSSDFFNRMMSAAKLSYCGNFANGFPTDCPHREKNGWTGDAAIASEFAQYLCENTAGYEKWLKDVQDAQLPNGKIPGIVPAGVWGGVRDDFSYGPVWDPLPTMLWNLWTCRGDRRILEEMYPALVKDIDYLTSRADADGLVDFGLGDWCPVNGRHAPSVRYTSSCTFYHAQVIAARIAAVLERDDDAARFAAGAEKTRAGIRSRLCSADGVHFENGRQTAQAMALTMGLTDDLVQVAETLRRDIEATGRALDVGLVGSKHLFRALSEGGYTDLAYELLTTPTGRSMADWIARGSTTLWEDFNTGRSRNHIMFGDFAAWAYEYLAGIRAGDGESAMIEVQEPGFKEFVLAPQLTRHLDFVEAETKSPYGVIKSAWHRLENGVVRFDFTVPPNSSARVRLPGEAEQVVGSGEWTFAVTDSVMTVKIDFTQDMKGAKFACAALLPRLLAVTNGMSGGYVQQETERACRAVLSEFERGGWCRAEGALAVKANGRFKFMLINDSRTEVRQVRFEIKGGPRFFVFGTIDGESRGLRIDGRIKSGDKITLEPRSVVFCQAREEQTR